MKLRKDLNEYSIKNKINDLKNSKGVENLKHKLSKYSSITKGGKYFNKKGSKSADKQIETLLGNNKAIKELNKILVNNLDGFPNTKSKNTFSYGPSYILSYYMTIHKAYDENNITLEEANSLIKDLRIYVKYLIDYKLASVYRMFNESADVIDSSDEIKTDKRLKSNTAPMVLNILGGSLGAFSFLTDTEWFKNIFNEEFVQTIVEEPKEALQKVKDIVSIKPGEGMTQMLQRFNGGTPMNTYSDFLNNVTKFGGGDLQQGIKNLHTMADNGLFPKNGFKEALTDVINSNSSPDTPLNDVFINNTDMDGKNYNSYFVAESGSSEIIKNVLIKGVAKTITKTAIKATAGAGIVKALGTLAGPLGVGLVATGAAIKGLRNKGLKNSRHATLSTLYKQILPLEPKENDLDSIDNKDIDDTKQISMPDYDTQKRIDTNDDNIRKIDNNDDITIDKEDIEDIDYQEYSEEPKNLTAKDNNDIESKYKSGEQTELEFPEDEPNNETPYDKYIRTDLSPRQKQVITKQLTSNISKIKQANELLKNLIDSSEVININEDKEEVKKYNLISLYNVKNDKLGNNVKIDLTNDQKEFIKLYKDKRNDINKIYKLASDIYTLQNEYLNQDTEFATLIKKLNGNKLLKNVRNKEKAMDQLFNFVYNKHGIKKVKSILNAMAKVYTKESIKGDFEDISGLDDISKTIIKDIITVNIILTKLAKILEK